MGGLKMDYENVFDKTVEKFGKEEIGRLIVGEICPNAIGLEALLDCGTYPQNCSNCWARALGMEEEIS
jgi:hypothetical protein